MATANCTIGIFTGFKNKRPRGITKAMVDAGYAVLSDFDPEWSSTEQAVIEVWEAMAAAKARKKRKK